MLKLPQKVLLPSTVILGVTLVLATRTVAQVFNPSDTQPTDSTVQSAPSRTERYGCLSGYNDGSYRGNATLTRYEFAAAVNACLNQIDRLTNSRRANLATQEDLATTKRELETLRSELESLQRRLDGLDSEKKQ